VQDFLSAFAVSFFYGTAPFCFCPVGDWEILADGSCSFFSFPPQDFDPQVAHFPHLFPPMTGFLPFISIDLVNLKFLVETRYSLFFLFSLFLGHFKVMLHKAPASIVVSPQIPFTTGEGPQGFSLPPLCSSPQWLYSRS